MSKHYTKVLTLGHRFIDTILIGLNHVEEKVDGCFTGDTLIMKSDGKLIPISKIVEEKLCIEVMSFNKDLGKMEPKKVTNFFKYRNEDRKQGFIKIFVKGKGQYRNWNTIKTTRNHMFYTSSGKKLAGELVIGDKILRPQYKIDYNCPNTVFHANLEEGIETGICHICRNVIPAEDPDGSISQNDDTFRDKVSSLIETEIFKIENVNCGYKYKYDIEVEDNHNYFAQHMLVSNSQFNFGIDFDYKLWIYSHSAVIHPEAPPAMFKEMVEYVISIQAKLIPGYSYHGEILSKPKHNILSYGRVPKNGIILFDVEDEYGNPLPYKLKKQFGIEIELETVPILGRNISYKDDLLNLLDTATPILGGADGHIEGVVVKNYDKLTPDGKYMVGKLVSERFKEKHGKEWKSGRPGKKEITIRLIEELRTEARWNKAIQHLREQDEIVDEPKDIGKIIKEVIKDIEEEETEYIKEELYKEYIKSIKTGATIGIPEWYKRRLLDNLK